MKIGVIDDERPARRELMYLIRDILPEAELYEAETSEEMMDILKTEPLDVCFLDINLGETNGTTLAARLKRIRPNLKLIFATAYPDYAIRAFELGAVDYLLKPFDPERVEAALERLTSISAVPVSAAPGPLNKLMVQNGESLRILDSQDVIYIETGSHCCHIYTAKECFTENQTLSYYEEHLPADTFFRVHKSYLVNLTYLRELVPTYNNGYACRLRHHEKTLLPVGRNQIRLLRQRLM